jgi:hypothetical protein
MSMQRSSSAPVLATKLSTIRSTPKWSFRAKPQIKESFQNAPGPGAYNVPSPDKFGKFGSSAKFSFQAATRDALRGGQAPGPGAYTPNNPNLRTRGGVAFATAGRNDTARSQSPGPGAYNLKNMLSTRNGTIPRSGRDAGKDSHHTPGPAAYNPDYQKLSGPSGENTPRWTFGRSGGGKENKSNATPGPGAYSPALPGNSTPKFSIPGKRPMSAGTISPGPSIMITTIG